MGDSTGIKLDWWLTNIVEVGNDGKGKSHGDVACDFFHGTFFQQLHTTRTAWTDIVDLGVDSREYSVYLFRYDSKPCIMDIPQ